MGFWVGVRGVWRERDVASEIKRREGGARSHWRHHTNGRYLAALTAATAKHSDRHFRHSLRPRCGYSQPEEIPYKSYRQASDCSWKHCHLVFPGR